ncbi:MAG: AbrB/MazE/SpoVT family DNA-binding domain-containing protein [Sedimentisphaerales bacterium]|nr:AbrB/MazE/SpoVT family DNA-binding domain-containing protein [Sedimentisphaerales bacterium]
MIANMATTKMSSKGQVVIPEIIRKALGLESGCQFLVLGEKDAVILKSISAPSKKEVNSLLSKARKKAKKAGLKPRDIANAVKKIRGGK